MKTNRIKQTMMSALAVVLLVVAAASFVKASAQSHTGHNVPQPPQQTTHTGHGQTADMPFDLHFIDMMIMHHEQGIEMARLAQEKGADARVKAFAKKTADDQQRDLLALRGHRQHWYSDRPQMDHAQMTAMMQSMPGHQKMQMNHEADFEKLRVAEARAFDLLFLDTMTHHHAMAVEMSKEAQQKAEHKEIKEFARKAVVKQQGEIAEMKRIRTSLGGKTTKSAARKTTTKKKSSGHGKH